MKPQLHISTNSHWNPIPDWADWYIRSGMMIGSLEKDGTRLTAGIAVPLRQYACLFLAFGIIYQRSSIPIDSYNKEEYFDYLKSFPPSSAVSLLMKEKDKLKIRNGKVDSVFKQAKGDTIGITYIEDKKKNLRCTRYFGVNECRSIVMCEESDVSVGGVKTKGISVANNIEFLTQFFEYGDLPDFVTTSRLDCILLSTKKRLFNEFNYDFGVKSSESMIAGSLMDVIRPRIIRTFSRSFRSEIYSSSSKKLNHNGTSPWCVIFDSCNGYLKWNHLFPSAHQVIIVDKSEKVHDVIGNDLNQRYFQRDNSSMFGLDFPAVPKGIEVLSFLEKIDD
jgi:hypothetical protein